MGRFMAKVSVTPGGCWEWTAGKDSKGYGVFRAAWKGKDVKAHRAAYELFVGPIPEGLTLDHLCNTKHCVNPTHLQPVSGRLNTRRGHIGPAAMDGDGHCGRGHEMTAENTYTSPKGIVSCRTCERERHQRNSQDPEQRAKNAAAQARYRLKTRGPEPRPTGRPKGSYHVTHCPQGHPYDEANTIYATGGGRKCRLCVQERQRRWQARNREHVNAKARIAYQKRPKSPEQKERKRQYDRERAAQKRKEQQAE